jgi:hypothetical protein
MFAPKKKKLVNIYLNLEYKIFIKVKIDFFFYNYLLINNLINF